MKPFIKLIGFLLFVMLIWHSMMANPIMIHYFSEFKFNGENWVIEMRNNWVDFGDTDSLKLDGWSLASKSDTVFFKNGIILTGSYLLITPDSLQAPLKINPAGDEIVLFNTDGYQVDWFRFSEDSNTIFHILSAPSPHQSISIYGDSTVPRKYHLFQNYPNPFNTSTTIRYTLPIDDYVEINIYNLNGKLVKHLFSGFQKASTYHLSWEASFFSSGVYIYCLETGNRNISRKCLLMK